MTTGSGSGLAARHSAISRERGNNRSSGPIPYSRKYARSNLLSGADRPTFRSVPPLVVSSEEATAVLQRVVLGAGIHHSALNIQVVGVWIIGVDQDVRPSELTELTPSTTTLDSQVHQHLCNRARHLLHQGGNVSPSSRLDPTGLLLRRLHSQR